MLFDAVLDDVAQPFARLVPLDQLIRSAAAPARELDHPGYHCLYPALGDAEGLPVVSADQRLLAAVHGAALARRAARL